MEIQLAKKRPQAWGDGAIICCRQRLRPDDRLPCSWITWSRSTNLLLKTQTRATRPHARETIQSSNTTATNREVLPSGSPGELPMASNHVDSGLRSRRLDRSSSLLPPSRCFQLVCVDGLVFAGSEGRAGVSTTAQHLLPGEAPRQSHPVGRRRVGVAWGSPRVPPRIHRQPLRQGQSRFRCPDSHGIKEKYRTERTFERSNTSTLAATSFTRDDNGLPVSPSGRSRCLLSTTWVQIVRN